MGFEDECIASHNSYRKAHGAEPLRKKGDLTHHAQQWAAYLAKSGNFQHSQDSKFGENIAMTSRPNPTGETITKMWYDEIHEYNFSRPGFKSGTGHFTQVVWRGTTHIGVGIASGPYGTFAVANYEPAGNVTNPGYFEQNVLRSDRPVPPAGSPGRRAPSSSDDDAMNSNSRRAQSGGNTETKVSTKVKEFVDSQGRRVKETTTTTTTTTKKGGSTSTSTKTDVKTEYLSSGGGSGGSERRRDDRLLDGFNNVSLDDKKAEKLSESEKKKFRKECVDRHNELRRLHGAPSLTASSSLDAKAQKWAEHLLMIRRLEHSSDREIGENVAYKFASDQRIFSGDVITDMWYNEIKKYNFQNPGSQSGTGHFTQVVWEASKEIGVGVAIDGRGTLFAVANYSPAGNFMSRFKDNVKPPKN